MLTNDLHLVLRLRINGAIPQIPLYAFLAWRGTNLPFLTCLCFKADVCNGIVHEAQKNSREIVEILQVPGAEVMSISAVFRWWTRFKEGNKMVIIDAVGRGSSTAITDFSIRTAHVLLSRTEG
jgi:hypothetical protein